MVARQMYKRDLGRAGLPTAYPAIVLCDERLPPTPPEWWAELLGERT